MGTTIHPLFAYHPISVVGSFMAGGSLGGVAKHDAEPLPEPEPRRARERLAVLLRRLRPAAA